MYMLYIDPGTGSMLFSILIGMLVTLMFFLQNFIIKIKFVLAGGKGTKVNEEKIPYIIFSDSKRYWNVFEPICDECENRKIDLKYYTASPDDPGLLKKYEHVKCEFIGEGNKAFARLNMMKASICLSTTPGLEVYQWKRSRDIDWYVHIFHAVDEGTGYRMFGLDFYDAVLLTGEFQERYIHILEKKRNLKGKEVCVTGSTYMDALGQKALKYKKDVQNSMTTVLLAPSWGTSSILNVYGEDIIDALLDTGFKIVIRPHPQSMISEKKMMDSLIEKYKGTEHLIWNFDNDNFDVLNHADIMITDFSGIIFDFSLVFDRPVIYADVNFDDAPYDASWIDEKLWRFEVLEKIGRKLEKKDLPKLGEIIKNLLEDNEMQHGRQEVRKEAWQYQYESAVRTVDYLQQKYQSLNKDKSGE